MDVKKFLFKISQITAFKVNSTQPLVQKKKPHIPISVSEDNLQKKMLNYLLQVVSADKGTNNRSQKTTNPKKLKEQVGKSVPKKPPSYL